MEAGNKAYVTIINTIFDYLSCRLFINFRAGFIEMAVRVTEGSIPPVTDSVTMEELQSQINVYVRRDTVEPAVRKVR